MKVLTKEQAMAKYDLVPYETVALFHMKPARTVGTVKPSNKVEANTSKKVKQKQIKDGTNVIPFIHS